MIQDLNNKHVSAFVDDKHNSAFVGDYDYKLCRTQAEIYRYMTENGYNIECFSNAFLTSKFCNEELDDVYSRFHIEFPNECADFFMPEIESKLSKGKTEYYDACAGSIGFIYRALHICTSIPSKELATIVPFDEVGDEALTTLHYTYEEVTEHIVQRHNLPLKRYDADFVRLTPEQFQQMTIEAQERYEALQQKYIG